MEREETKVKGLSEIRFSWIIFFLRVAGIPFKMKKMSTVYVIYIINAIISTFSMLLGMFVEVYIYRDDLSHVISNIRPLFGISGLVWLYISCR
jgi:hypothetical protein